MMKTVIVLLFLFFSAGKMSGQNIVETYSKEDDSLRIGSGKDDFLRYNDKGYTLILPDTTGILTGVLISFEDRKFDWQNNPTQQIFREAITKNFAVLYISTGIPVDLFFSEKSLVYIDTVLKNVFGKYTIPNKNIFFLGVNLAGHRALQYLEFCKKKSNFHPDTKEIVLVDGVLDWVRQWYEGEKGKRDNFAASSVFEGKLVTYLLEKNLGATPKTNLETYLDFSPYSYFDERSRHIKYFKEYAVRAYTEPATHYWLNTKRKTTFDTNFPDMVGMINALKLAGSTKSELIVFDQDKSNMDQRSPAYTWGLVDKAELMNWVILQTK